MKFVFIMTHLGSGYEALSTSLNLLSGVRCVKSNKVYTHPTEFEPYFGRYQPVKTFVDTILFNHQIANPAFFDVCNFVYLVRGPDWEAIKKGGYTEDYYYFRLRRMYETAYRTGGLFLTWEDLKTAKGRELLGKVIGKEYRCDLSGESAADGRYSAYVEKFRNLRIDKV